MKRLTQTTSVKLNCFNGTLLSHTKLRHQEHTITMPNYLSGVMYRVITTKQKKIKQLIKTRALIISNLGPLVCAEV